MKGKCMDEYVTKQLLNPKISEPCLIALNDLKCLYYATHTMHTTLQTQTAAQYLLQLFDNIISDINQLLSMTHQDFWHHFKNNYQLSIIMNTVLYFFGRLSFLQYVDEKLVLNDDTTCKLDVLLTKGFRLLMRLSNPSEDSQYISFKVFKGIIYEEYIFYSPMIFEILLVYAPLERDTTLAMIESLYKVIPDYFDDVEQGFKYMIKDFGETVKTLDPKGKEEDIKVKLINALSILYFLCPAVEYLNPKHTYKIIQLNIMYDVAIFFSKSKYILSHGLVKDKRLIHKCMTLAFNAIKLLLIKGITDYCNANTRIAYSKLKDFITYIGNTGNTPESMYFGYLLYKLQLRLQISKVVADIDDTILSSDEKSLLKAIIGSVEELYKK